MRELCERHGYNLLRQAYEPRYRHVTVHVVRTRRMLPGEKRNAEIARLRAEAEVDMRHATALEAETDVLLRQSKVKVGPDMKPDDPRN